MAAFDILLAGITVQGHPVRIYLFGHEGIGFIGQPGTAKDVVYKGAHIVIGLANDDDVQDLLSVLQSDLARENSRGRRPGCVVACPTPSPKLADPDHGVEGLWVDWRTRPLEPLNRAVKLVTQRYRQPTNTPDPPQAKPPRASAARAPDPERGPAQRIVAANLARVEFAALTAPWEITLSPIWERGPTGSTVRRGTLAPRAMRAHYFEGAALDLLRRPDLDAIVIAMAQRMNERPDPRHPPADLENLYCAAEAPFVEVSNTWTPELGALSLVIADAARRARVGATVEQIMAYELSPEQSDSLNALEDDFRMAVIEAPVDDLVEAMADPASDRAAKPRKPWWRFW
jgi:hypothetical protein